MSDTIRSTGNISRDTGGLDEDGVLWDASFGCDDCGLNYSWPVTPGLAPNKDPKQTEMLALVAKHTPAACRTNQARDAVEREKELAAEAAETYDDHQNVAVQLAEVNMLVATCVKNEADGYPCPISGDPTVTLQEAIDRGAVTVAKGLPAAVVWRRDNPELAKTHAFVEFKTARLGIWPTPSHQALTDSFAALADVQRRLMIGGVLQCRGDNVDARSAL